MKCRHNSVRLSLVAALAVAFIALLVPHSAQAQAVSKTAMAGPYSVTLKVLPAEGFTGASSPMVHDSGAKPVTVNGPMHPNHHMVAFVKENGKPVEKAHVEIWYRMTTNSMMGNKNEMGSSMNKMNGMSKWMTLPVARMHVRGKGPATTHYGNNVKLAPGSYEVKVSVNGKTAMFHFSLS